MINREETNVIIQNLYNSILSLFPDENMEVILFGSCARGDSIEGSDIDVMILVDDSRENIAKKNWQVGNAAGDLLIDHGILISPIIENREWFYNNANVIPLFKNISREGIRINV